jgi:tetratricopeptide (TPR) repeat protein
MQDFLGDRRVAARQLESKGAWREALRQWQIIDAVSPGDVDVDREIARLEQEVDSGFERHWDAARALEKKGRLRKSRARLIQALALRPDDPDAIAALKDVEARLVYAAMPAAPTISKAPQSEIDVYTAGRAALESRRSEPDSAPMASDGRGTSVGTGPRQRAAELASQGSYEAALKVLLSLRDTAQTDAAIDVRIDELRRLLAERHFARGVAAFREARYGEAVTEFELTLRYEPNHHKARFYHSSAEALSKPSR